MNNSNSSTKIFSSLEQQKIKLLSQCKPGLYMILCLVNDYRYFGESSNVASRFAGHRKNLRSNKHANDLLQKDFNLYGESNFQFSVLYLGDEWGERNVRLVKESQLIAANLDKVYNILKTIY